LKRVERVGGWLKVDKTRIKTLIKPLM